MRLILFISLINCLIVDSSKISHSKIEVIKSDEDTPVNIDDYFPSKSDVRKELKDKSNENTHDSTHLNNNPKKNAKINKNINSDISKIKFVSHDSKSNQNNEKNHPLQIISDVSNNNIKPIVISQKEESSHKKAYNVKEEVFINLENKDKAKTTAELNKKEDQGNYFTNVFTKKFFTMPDIFKFGFNSNEENNFLSNSVQSPLRISFGNNQFDDFDNPSFYHDDIIDDAFNIDKDDKIEEKSNNYMLSRFEFSRFPSFVFPRIFRFDTAGNDLEDQKNKGNRVALFIYRWKNKDKVEKDKDKKPQPHIQQIEIEKDENKSMNTFFENYNLDDYRVYSNVLLLVIGVLLIISGIKLCLLLTRDRRKSQTLYQIDETQLIFDDSISEKDKKLKS